MNKDEQWLLREKYGCVENTELFNESWDKIIHNYHWGKDFHNDCDRLKAGEPLAYLIGHIPFLETTIYLDSKPLIPRPETEYWVEKAIASIKGVAAKPPRVLDLCAGSGAIGVAVAHHIPNALVEFAEIDEVHLPTIGKNLQENQITCTDYRVWQSNLFENITGEFDFILSNPPYINREAFTVESSVTDYEPHLALFGGEAGLELINKIIKDSPLYLKDSGQLWLEHEPAQTESIALLGAENGFIVSTFKDQYHVERYSVLKRRMAE